MRRIVIETGKALRVPVLVICSAAVAYLAWIGLDGSLAGLGRTGLPSIDARDLGQRVLVVSPHPDDETLAAGGLIRDATDGSRSVRVVEVTCGDGFKRIAGNYASKSGGLPALLRLGDVRANEARRAAGVLGVRPGDVTFLGYPDGSLSRLWAEDWDSSSSCFGANGRSTVPYAFALRPGASYTGSSLASDLAAVIADFSPTAVVYPDGEDANADHWAVNAFTELALDRAGYDGARYTYLVHRGHFPFPWSYLPEAWLRPPRTLTSLGVEWLEYPLTRSTERVKERALERHASQQRAIEPFMAAFVRRNELFAAFRPVAVSVASTADLDASAMPGVVIRDPSADTLLRAVDPGGDVREVALIDGPDGTWLGLSAGGPIATGIGYRLSLRTVRPGGIVSRLDVDVRAGKAVAAGGGDRLPLRVRGDRLWVGLPPKTLAGADGVMAGAQTVQGGMVLDRTAWRPVRLP